LSQSFRHVPPVTQPPPGAASSCSNPNFLTYKKTLTQRLEGRVPRLHGALRTLEDAAALLQDDLVKMFADGKVAGIDYQSHEVVVSSRSVVIQRSRGTRGQSGN